MARIKLPIATNSCIKLKNLFFIETSPLNIDKHDGFMKILFIKQQG